MSPEVEDASPERLVLVLNPILKPVLASALGRLVGPFALLEFRGRRSQKAYRVPVGLHEVDGVPVVLTDAGWRRNFVGGAPVTVHHRGRRRAMRGTLVTDPQEVADAVNAVLDSGTGAGILGLKVAEGHVVTAGDIVAVGRQLVVLTADQPPSP